MRAYRMLLLLLPADFRREFGREMAEVVEEHWKATRPRLGAVGAVRFWVRQGWAVVRVAVGLRLGRRDAPGRWEIGHAVARAAREEEGMMTRGIRQDLRHALRGLAKRPGFAAVTVLTLGLGIGASTAVFSAVRTVLLKPLPYGEPDRVLVVFHENRETGERGNGVSPANMQDLGARADLLSEVAVAEPWGADLQLDGQAESLRAWRVSEGFFEALGVDAALGRLFTPEEYASTERPVIVLGHGSWSNRFGADPRLVGSTVLLEGEAVTVAGVLPPDFELPDEAEFWTPRPPQPEDDEDRSADYMMGVARLAEGATLDQARAEVVSVATELAELYPETNRTRGFELVPLRDHLFGDVRTPLLVLLGAVGFVLLIACANVAGLVLARGVRRRREYALRRALGATRGHLARQLTVESLLLAAGGCLLGIVIALLGMGAIRGLGPAHLPRIEELRLDGVVLAFAVAAAAVSALLAGIAPGVRMLRSEELGALGEAGRGATPGPGSARSGRKLVVAEVAAAMVLVVGAGLLAKSLITLLDRELGFETENRLALQTFAYDLEGPGAREAFIREVEARMEAIPGVREVALTSSVPGADDGVLAAIDVDLPFTLEDRAAPPPGQEPTAAVHQVSHDFFQVMGMRVVGGRGFRESDDAEAPRVVVVNETLARRHFGPDPAVGRSLVIGYRPVPREIVGVVADVRPRGHESDPRPEVYFPLAQLGTASLTFVLQADVDAASLARPAREAVWAVNPGQAVWGAATVEDLLGEWVRDRRFNLLLLGGFAGVALLLAAIGVYGLVSFTVEQRMAELGIRRVLGGHDASILVLVLGDGVRMAGAGILLGIVAALGLTRFARGMLYGIEPTDPVILAAVSAGVLGVAALASLLPAVRALRADPVAVLRDD